ncbi:unnamed protein product [Schistosoma turkestanicum]|nr:unnamed protein product [Schistosoma turkestanicum]CAH8428577.1 unnamed protein product [Schistosoma turkestanicum]
MHVCSRIDPLFFFISFCRKKDKFISWEVILSELGECFHVLSNIPDMEHRLEEICDKKCIGDLSVYRYNESRAIEWLSNKVSAVYKASFNCKDPVLISQFRLIASNSSSNHTDEINDDSRVPEFTSSSKEAQLLSTNQLSHEACLNLAYQMVADYLPPDLWNKLREKIGLKTTTVELNLSENGSAVIISENIDPIDNRSLEKSFDLENCQPNKDDSCLALKLNESKVNEPTTKKAKIPKGLQSITNFFVKK